LQAKLVDGSLKIKHSRQNGSCLLLLISDFTPVMFVMIFTQRTFGTHIHDNTAPWSEENNAHFIGK
jgi:hypothetical protein